MHAAKGEESEGKVSHGPKVPLPGPPRSSVLRSTRRCQPRPVGLSFHLKPLLLPRFSRVQSAGPEKSTRSPGQNNLKELHALLKFLWPDVLAKQSEATEHGSPKPC